MNAQTTSNWRWPLRVFACAGIALAVSCSRPPEPTLSVPGLTPDDYETIAARIYQNEALGQPRYLTHWNEGEDFPSFGIGHFIWFPGGVDAPFDETFPAMVEFQRQQVPAVSIPEWLATLDPFDAPWRDKQAFDDAIDSPRLRELRAWLEDSAMLQARFIVHSFIARWNALSLPDDEKSRLEVQLEKLLATPAGLYAVIDYYNFKGLGSNPRERYDGEGWGLLQVLADTVAARADASAVEAFSRAAAARLSRRVANAPAERGEARWLEGWLRRVNDYRPGTTDVFAVTPYLQSLNGDGLTLMWFAVGDAAGTVLVAEENSAGSIPRVWHSAPRRADALAYHAGEGVADTPLPYRHAVKIRGLEPGTRYRYVVNQDGSQHSGSFRTAAAANEPLRFIVYADSETEPESGTERVAWPAAGADGENRRYLLDQSAGYAANLRVMRGRTPDFIAIAGDLVESGGEQRDWDEFWRHNRQLASAVPIYPAIGNHDYFAGPGEFGGYTGAARALAKFHSYFSLPGSSDAAPPTTYYAHQQGPVTLIVMDSNNGLPERSASDTNWYLSATASGTAGWQPGSPQYRWLERSLRQAQRDSALTFVMLHHAPYSSGVHNLPPGTGDGENFSSGLPLRELTPLFLRFGVDAVFSGHDELYEHSLIVGQEQRVNGVMRPQDLHFFVIGTGGDGLRGPAAGVDNPHRLFLAHRDAPEQYDGNGVLTDGGRHYGHLEVNVETTASGEVRARIEPVYVFPLARANGDFDFERRVYDDVTVLTVPAPSAGDPP